MKHIPWTFALATTALAAALPAAAEPMPGMRGADHFGMTVPNLDDAVSFFTDIIGCQKITGFGPISDGKGTFMQDALDVDPRAVIETVALVRCGNGSNLELFQYSAPDQKTVSARNSDIGGHHIAFYVDDIKAAADYLNAHDVKTLMGPIPINDGPIAGQSILYFYTPWGFQLEAISYPDGMAYAKTAETRLWSPKDAD